MIVSNEVMGRLGKADKDAQDKKHDMNNLIRKTRQRLGGN